MSQWKVNIISLSLGFQERVGPIEEAIRKAQDSKVLVFAAAGNFGGNSSCSWPARHNDVIAIYATDGKGNPYEGNPTAKPGKRDPGFATLGVEVSAQVPTGGFELRSGTSIATPVAVGIASHLIHFMRVSKQPYLQYLCRNTDSTRDNVLRVRCTSEKLPSTGMQNDYDGLVGRIFTVDGMEALFGMMAVDRQEYKYLCPKELIKQHGTGFDLVTNILRKLRSC